MGLRHSCVCAVFMMYFKAVFLDSTLDGLSWRMKRPKANVISAAYSKKSSKSIQFAVSDMRKSRKLMGFHGGWVTQIKIVSHQITQRIHSFLTIGYGRARYFVRALNIESLDKPWPQPTKVARKMAQCHFFPTLVLYE